MVAFYQGLKDEIKDELAKQDRPEEFADYVAMADRIDNRLFERRMEKRTSTHLLGNPSWTYGTRRDAAPGERDPVLQLQSAWSRFARMYAAETTEQEDHSYRATNRHGHIAKECPERRYRQRETLAAIVRPDGRGPGPAPRRRTNTTGGKPSLIRQRQQCRDHCRSDNNAKPIAENEQTIRILREEPPESSARELTGRLITSSGDAALEESLRSRPSGHPEPRQHDAENHVKTTPNTTSEDAGRHQLRTITTAIGADTSHLSHFTTTDIARRDHRA
ncbi:hypothetical protein F4825DRAFT_476928 [Nemania diffusa]|nr:hypothetical protein F4825DRAFT_476928 [Nemania diffusa]